MIKELTIEKASLLESWETKSLGEICEMIKRGSQPKYTESADGEIVLNQKCIRDHKINLSVARKHDTSKKTINKERYIQLGDGLINSTGTGTLGRVAQVRELNFSAFVDTHITIVRPIKNLFFLDFFGWMLIHIEKEIEGLGEGASGQTELSRKIVESINVSFPSSKDQQKQIVAILDKAFAAIDIAKANAEQNLKNAKELFESYLQNVFENKGDDWRVEKLGVLGKLTSSKRIYKKEYVSSGVPFYRSKEIKELSHKRKLSIELYISEQRYTEIKNKFGIPKQGDLLLTAVGTIGEMYIVKKDEKFYFKDGNIMWLKDFSSLNSYYLKYALTNFVERLKALSQGTAYSALTIEKLKEYSIPIPPIKEQEKIVQKLDALSVETKKLEAIYIQKIADLEEMKKSVLQKAFSGQLNTIN